MLRRGTVRLRRAKAILRELGREVDGPAQAVVVLVGLVEEGELGVGPVEVAGVGDDAAYGGAVAAQPLGERVDDDVRAELDRLEQVGRREGGVDDEGQVVLLRDLGNRGDVGDVEGGVADSLDVEEAGLGRDGLLEALRDRCTSTNFVVMPRSGKIASKRV